MQSEIAASAYAYQQAIERGDKVIVGVNKFVQEETVRPETLKVDEGARARQIEVLRAIRERRDASAVQRGLAGIRSAAVEQRNLMPPILAAVEAEATVGEISDVLRSVWGEYEGR
jgi:methylmalonyl-CoA mutase N-terminal domain/subunit